MKTWIVAHFIHPHKPWTIPTTRPPFIKHPPKPMHKCLPKRELSSLKTSPGPIIQYIHPRVGLKLLCRVSYMVISCLILLMTVIILVSKSAEIPKVKQSIMECVGIAVWFPTTLQFCYFSCRTADSRSEKAD